MSSSLLSVARSALLTHQTSLQTISQNIANAETPGYSRQEAIISTNTPTRMTYGVVGTGVHVDTIIRRRDQFLDDSFRSADGLASGADLRRDLMGQVESIFGEPSDEGMSKALDAFWTGWSDLASAPSSLSARTIIQQRGRQAAALFNEYDTQLTQQRSATLERLQSSVATINSVAAQVADLNMQIASSELSGNTANDLRDLRDGKLDELAKLGGTRSLTQTNGSITVLIGNATLVQGDSARKLSLAYEVTTPPPATPVIDVKVRLHIGNSPDPVTPLPSEIKAVMDVLNVDIPDTRSRLDALAAQMVSAVNTVHTTG
jgi:flagellar hook-associated protein 1 FlgK